MMQLFFSLHNKKRPQRFLPCGMVVLFSFFTITAKSQTKDTSYAPTDTANIYFNDSAVRISTSNDSFKNNIVQAPTSSPEIEETDTTETGNKKIYGDITVLSEDSVNAIRKSKGLGYMVYLDSLLRAREDAKKKKPLLVTEPPENTNSLWDAGIIKVLCWATAIGVVGFVLYKIFLGQGSAFTSNTKNNIPELYIDTELAEDDLDGQLKKAIQQKNYRQATRYLFLQTLQQLADKNAISLSTEKTNLQYTNELNGKPYADSFARLCFLYEYVWFGEFDINEAQFQSIQQQQQQLAKAI